MVPNPVQGLFSEGSYRTKIRAFCTTSLPKDPVEKKMLEIFLSYTIDFDLLPLISIFVKDFFSRLLYRIIKNLQNITSTF
jgi:hypothetical protein